MSGISIYFDSSLTTIEAVIAFLGDKPNDSGHPFGGELVGLPRESVPPSMLHRTALDVGPLPDFPTGSATRR